MANDQQQTGDMNITTPEQDSSSTLKRGRDSKDQGSGTQNRTKRNRYISIACNECKRRKIKCNGETPCHRCGNLNLECIYAPNCCNTSLKNTNEYRQLTEQIEDLYAHVAHLTDNLNALRSALGQEDYHSAAQSNALYRQDGTTRSQGAAPQASMAIDPALQSNRPPTRTSAQQSRFQGPTSSAFSLGVAKSSLQNMGIANPDDATVEQAMLSQTESGPTQVNNLSTNASRPWHPSKDPIWQISKDEGLRLCRKYEEEIGILYPILEIEHVIKHAAVLFTFVAAASKTLMRPDLPGDDSLEDQETDILKLVLANALTTEGSGQSDVGKRLFERVARTVDRRLVGNVNLKDVQILTLTAIYYFHTDDEGLAWRFIGLTARLCIELGLHRRETYTNMFTDETDRNSALKLFWSIYTLDHRWSFGMGMSFALQENDIDPDLPKPTESSPYLTAMISYSNITSKVWKSVSTFDSQSSSSPNHHSSASSSKSHHFTKDEMNYLDYQINQWYNSVPLHLRFIHPSSSEYAQAQAQNPSLDPNEANGGRALYRLRVLLYLRANQMHISIYRPLLHSSSTISSNFQDAKKAIDVAKDTIKILTHINTRSDIYKTQQMTYNHFLLSALAAIFLGACHAPGVFAEDVRDEFYMGLELVRGLSRDSYVSQRLWKTIRGLKEVAPKLGLYARNQNTNLADVNGADNQQQTQPQHLHQQRHMNRPSSSPLSTGTASTTQTDAQRSAAMAMAGLAGHQVDENYFSSFSTSAPQNPSGVQTQQQQRNSQPLNRGSSQSFPQFQENNTNNNNISNLASAAAAAATNATNATTNVDNSNNNNKPRNELFSNDLFDFTTQNPGPLRSPDGMANDLTSLFEAVNAFTSANPPDAYNSATSATAAATTSSINENNTANNENNNKIITSTNTSSSVNNSNNNSGPTNLNPFTNPVPDSGSGAESGTVENITDDANVDVDDNGNGIGNPNLIGIVNTPGSEEELNRILRELF